MMNTIGIPNDNMALTKTSDQLRRLIYNEQRAMKRERTINITYDNRHTRADSPSLESLMELVSESD